MKWLRSVFLKMTTRWNFKSRIVSTICKYKSECLQKILDDDSNPTSHSCLGLEIEKVYQDKM